MVPPFIILLWMFYPFAQGFNIYIYLFICIFCSFERGLLSGVQSLENSMFALANYCFFFNAF